MEPPAGAPPRLRPLYDVDPALAPLYEEIADCPRCSLARTRSRTVPGSGPIDADLMFIGEGPGQREDELGLPFVGRAGEFLDQLLAGIGRTRTDVYVCNVVKCRPPGNRDPLQEELTACADFLERQIALVNPRVIATLGRFSMARWFADARISRIHGQPATFDGRVVIPMYHPAAALRNPALREVMKQDFEKIPALLGRDADAGAVSRASATPPPAAAVPPPPPATPAAPPAARHVAESADEPTEPVWRDPPQERLL
jgi:uracil-DNA glycosylase family 4